MALHSAIPMLWPVFFASVALGLGAVAYDDWRFCK